MWLHAILITSLGFGAAATLYAFGLAGVARILRPRRDPGHAKPGAQRFLIVIPAHDEEATLPGTLQACAALDYPAERFAVVVIADNCTDRTAEVTRTHGARCLERHDTERRGKGFALEWALALLAGEDHDAVLVLDADCTVDPAALRVFDARLREGARALQASYVASNAAESPTSYVVALGMHMLSELFCAPKSRLGLAVFLLGTGIVLHRDVLARLPWKARGVTEDTEYSLDLLRQNIPIVFVPEIHVWSRFPAGRRQLEVQRRRWAGGNLELCRHQSAPLILLGLRRGDRRLFDAGWTLLVLSRPLILFVVLGTVLLAWVDFRLQPGGLSRGLLALSIAVLGLQGLYFASSAMHFGLGGGRLKLLLRSPVVIVRLALLTLGGLLRVGKPIWERTPRD